MVMRAGGRLSAITKMYEAAAATAAAAGPAAAEMAINLTHEVFGAHVRECSYVKQQQVALKLTKAAAAAAAFSPTGGFGFTNHPTGPGVPGELRYSWWVVLSILLQARAALKAAASGRPAPPGQVPPVALEPSKLLALAEGMVARQASKDKRLEGYEAAMVYVDLLLAQGKAADALALVSGPLGESALRMPGERLQLRAALAAAAGDPGAGAALLAEGLRANPDDWGALCLLLDCLLPGTAPGAQSSGHFFPQHPLLLISGGLAEQLPPRGAPLPEDGGASPEAFERAEALIQELVALSRQGGPEGAPASASAPGGGRAMTMRGPDLALVELAARRHRACPTPASEGAVAAAVLQYFKRYGSLVSCAVDLRPYVSALSEAAAERLAADVAAAAAEGPAAAEGGSSPNAAALAALRRRVCAAQVRDDCGLPRFPSAAAAVAEAGALLATFRQAQPLQEGLDERERGAADELPPLAAAALVTAAALAPSDSAAVPYLLSAYVMLTDVVRRRPYSGAARIAAASIAGLLAAPAAAAAHLMKLDIKHIQMDTLGSHLLLPPLLAWPDTSAPAAGAAPGGVPEAAPAPDRSPLARALRDTRALFEDHGRDAGETTFTAYNHGMYTKVLEFGAFRERLAAAHSLDLVRAEAALAEALRAGGGGGGGGEASGGSGGGEALRAAAVAAAEALPVEELPTADALRFNADLACRPTWLPPCPAGPSLQPSSWWRARAVGAPTEGGQPSTVNGQGYGRRWWTPTAAAEGTAPEAAAWRRGAAAAAAHRWLLPHAIAGALGASGPKVLPLRDAVERMRALLPDPTPAPGAAAGGGPAGARDPDAAVRGLDAQLYGAALAVQDALSSLSAAVGGAADAPASAAAASDVSPADAASSAAAALTALTAAARQAASAAADDVSAAAAAAAAGGCGGFLACGGLGLAAHLLREPLAVAAACLQSWQASVKALRKRRAKAAAADGSVDGAVSALADALTAAAAELAAAVGACGDALAAATQAAAAAGEPAAAAGAAVQYLLDQGHGPILGDAPPSPLEPLAREQRAVLAALSRQAAALAAALA
ncbi:hypothetical protein HYH03_007140 [Edaphochlamys debaryana]|uniref:Uncharacterized protein n=1 Tax=Edaphochlamys debaryana TaxID=47281 RepID=A0A836BZB6_9CHLO|nr:hypothetical protein HYH03_007140 [Edaphochlamys debaryana]|eukprot:KAG2494621.1 hypothetical protein HYH03_007140 [Edaphochlamys debaryana]